VPRLPRGAREPARARRRRGGLTSAPGEPLERLFEAETLPIAELPAELERLYGGGFALPADCLYANFVATLDGIVAIPSMPRSNEFIAGGSEADRFLMGLLRAHADAVLIGSGVLRASPRSTWRAEAIFPSAADAYAELRRNLEIPPTPEIAVVTGSGMIDPGHPVFEGRSVVLTSDAGAQRLQGELPDTTSIVALGPADMIPSAAIVGALRERGHRRILCEAGPHTFGGLLEDGVVAELFLTTSPLLVGTAGPGSRFSLVEGADLAPAATGGRLLSIRRDGSHVFTRYALDRGL
jgi:riboflavin biosynthesis pyrimidine reductase